MNAKKSPRFRPWHLALVASALLGLMVRTGGADLGRPDPPPIPHPPDWGVSSPTVSEGATVTKTVIFVFKSPIPGPLTYECNTYDKTATVADGDYLPVSGTRTLAAGQTQDSIAVVVNGDSKHEKDETFLLAVTGPGLSLLVGACTIVNDDQFPRFTTSDVAILEGNAGVTMVEVPLHLDRTSSTDIVLGYQTLEATASIADFDYTWVSGAVVVLAGQRDASVAIAIHGDTDREPSEALLVRFVDPLSPGHGQAQSAVTILTDDLAGPPAVTVTRPNGGESFVTGDQEQIAWTSSPDVTVDVLVSRNGGVSWTTLGQGQYDAGYAYWVADGDATDAGLVKVVVRDPTGGAAEDVSDAPFTIKKGQGTSDGTTPVLVMTGARALDAGVELRWRLAPGLGVRSVQIQRRESGTPMWLEIDPPRQNDGGTIVAIDTDVLPGRTYAYQLIVDLGQGDPMRVALSEVTVGATALEASLMVTPNPSRRSMWIRFVAPRPGPVRVSLHDVQGREVGVAAAGTFTAGSHSVKWEAPPALPQGLYFVRCASDGAVLSRRVTVVD